MKTMRPIRSFVKREGRMTPSQKNAFEKLWPQFGLTIADGLLDYQSVFKQEQKNVLEIGFGMGQSLATMAEAAPETNFIGIEVHRPGVGSLLATIEKNELNNIRIYNEDAVEVLKHCIADNSLDVVQIFFSDPWPKKRHHKRRLIQVEFVELLRAKLKPGGQLHLATDWENYAVHMLEVMIQVTGFENLAGDKNFCEKPAHRPITKFEERGHKLGHKTWELIYGKRV